MRHITLLTIKAIQIFMEVEASDTHPGNVQDFSHKFGCKFCSYIPGN